MDDQTKPKRASAQKCSLEKLDADAVRKLSAKTRVAIPYLLREAVADLTRKYQTRGKGETPAAGESAVEAGES